MLCIAMSCRFGECVIVWPSSVLLIQGVISQCFVCSLSLYSVFTIIPFRCSLLCCGPSPNYLSLTWDVVWNWIIGIWTMLQSLVHLLLFNMMHMEKQNGKKMMNIRLQIKKSSANQKYNSEFIYEAYIVVHL